MKTYSEQRQAILFKASRDLRAVAATVLDDVQQDAEFTGGTYAWAKALAKRTAETANELEQRGHEETIASVRAENLLYASREHYSQAIDAFEARLAAAQAREGERV
jgi:hypothetical protein